MDKPCLYIAVVRVRKTSSIFADRIHVSLQWRANNVIFPSYYTAQFFNAFTKLRATLLPPIDDMYHNLSCRRRPESCN
jgi:hypothetical protein